MNRRRFVTLALAAAAFPSLGKSAESSRAVFARIMGDALKNKRRELPIGELTLSFAFALQGTPYKAGTLEGQPETCRADLTGLDCVTLFENALCMARTLKLGKTSHEDFLEALVFTRYRGGKLDDYASRLHYTADWIRDNETKGVVRNVARELGGKPLALKVSFMSEHPDRYPALAANPALVAKIRAVENAANAAEHWYIPTEELPARYAQLQAGDIIAIASSKAGLDYSHTGLVWKKTSSDVPRLLHASLLKKKVTLDKPLAEALRAHKTALGATIARPLEP